MKIIITMRYNDDIHYISTGVQRGVFFIYRKYIKVSADI
jgi:hypothetical protein